jgi:hypothetical protein
METKKLFFGMVFATLVLLFMVHASAAEVIVINETSEKLYALESVLVSGDVNTNALALSGNGEVLLGENVKVYLFGPSTDILVKNVLVNGKETTVSFDQNGYFFLVPQAGKFTFTGGMDIRTIGQITLHVKGPLNSLQFNLKNGYSINGDEYGLYDKDVVLQRAEKAATLVDGSFRYTYAERNEFLYQLNLKSFGSSLGRYILNLNNNEQVSDVTGAGLLKWEQKGNTLLLDLEGSSVSLSIRGLFDSTSLRIPLPEDRHHVLIESDPEKKITVTTDAKEIDVSESPIGPQYSNARAFLASSSNVFEITVKQLDLLPSLAASVRSATNEFAITGKGSILADLTYSYANTGLDYLEINAPGVPLYASTSGGAVKLTKDNTLLLSFPKTSYGTLDVLYFNTTDELGWVSLIDVPTAQTDIPITTATTTIYLPDDQFVVKTLGAEGGSELPSLTSLVIFAVIFGIVAFMLRKSVLFTLSYLVFTYVLMQFSLPLFLVWVGLSLALIVKKHMPGTPTVKWILVGGAAFVILLIVLIVPFMLIWQLGIFNMGGASAPSQVYQSDYAVVEKTAVAPQFREMNAVGTGAGTITVPIRTGVLPVKLELPAMAKSITVKNDLVTKENQIHLQLLLVSTNLKYLAYFIALLALFVCKMEYRKEKENDTLVKKEAEYRKEKGR